MTAISMTDVSKRYGDHAPVLRDVNLEIASHEFCVFLGPSGCGKSTLLRMIAGLEDVTEGELRIGGARMNDTPPAERGVAMVFQSYALFPHMTVFDNIGFGLRIAGTPKDEIRRRVTEAARVLQLEALLDRKPKALSGGQRQRVAIGRAIVREPRVFLFDEPLSNLDAELRVNMRAELIDLHRRLGATMVYVTHDQVEAMTLADRIVVLNGGSVQQFGRPLDLYDDPDNRFVAGFIGSPRMNFLDAVVLETGPDRVTLGRIGGSDRSLSLPFRGFDPSVKEVVVGIRPEHARLGESGPDTVPVSIGFAEELGDVTYLHGKTPGRGQIIIRSDKGRFGGQSDCHVAFDLAGVRLFDTDGRRLRADGN